MGHRKTHVGCTATLGSQRVEGIPGKWALRGDVLTSLQFFTFAQYIFQVLSCTRKFVFLVLFRRIFWAQRTVKHLIYLGMVIVLCSNSGLLFATMFTYSPVQRAWTRSYQDVVGTLESFHGSRVV
jgi:hypothetical protein